MIAVTSGMFTNSLAIFPVEAVSKWEMGGEYEEYRRDLGNGHGLTYYICPDHAALVEVDWDWSGSNS